MILNIKYGWYEYHHVYQYMHTLIHIRAHIHTHPHPRTLHTSITPSHLFRHQLLGIRALDAEATRWSPVQDLTPMVFNTSEVDVTPGPGAGITVPTAAGERIVVALAAPFAAGTGGGVVLSDDGGSTWRLSGRANPRGGEAQVAVAQNGSLLLNSRGPTQGVRWESWSHDAGETWSSPVVSDHGFGSSCEGSVIRAGESLFFAHPGRIDDRYNRWNMTVWRSTDSGANWTAVEQVQQ